MSKRILHVVLLIVFFTECVINILDASLVPPSVCPKRKQLGDSFLPDQGLMTILSTCVLNLFSLNVQPKDLLQEVIFGESHCGGGKPALCFVSWAQGTPSPHKDA